jgi:hypothetical protein
MKIRYNHQNGIFLDKKNSSHFLCEVFAKRTDETKKYMFENGWLPTSNNEWFQTKSSRIKILPISSRKKNRLGKIHISKNGDYRRIFQESKSYYSDTCESYLETVLSFDNEIYYFNSEVFCVLNWFDNVPFFSAVFGGKVKRNGITPMTCYYFIDKLIEYNYPYLYIGEWYNQFHYKLDYPNFEWWNGEKWIKK